MKVCFGAVLLFSLSVASAAAQLEEMTPTLAHRTGTMPDTDLLYSSYYLNAAGTKAFDFKRPTLTVQCWKDASDKFRLDLLFHFDGAGSDDPWQPFHPTREHPTKSAVRGYEQLIFQFLGYVKVKPEKLEFEKLWIPDGELLYSQTGFHSHNLGPASSVLQYLQSLPIVRVSEAGNSAEFEAATLLEKLRKDPLCAASGLREH